MIIKIKPENDAEKARIQEVEHVGVKEFFIFGSKKDSDGESIDFHDWSGSYRYLIGSLHYFVHSLSDEQSGKSANAPTEINVKAAPNVIQMEPAKGAPMIKTGAPNDGKLEVVEVQDVKIDADAGAQPSLKVMDNEEMPVEEEEIADNSKGAED
jgi:hypothetical protein